MSTLWAQRGAGAYNGRPRAVPDLPEESIDDQEWHDRVAREARHQEVIEASRAARTLGSGSIGSTASRKRRLD
jgi:hypothetical protein